MPLFPLGSSDMGFLNETFFWYFFVLKKITVSDGHATVDGCEIQITSWYSWWFFHVFPMKFIGFQVSFNHPNGPGAAGLRDIIHCCVTSKSQRSKTMMLDIGHDPHPLTAPKLGRGHPIRKAEDWSTQSWKDWDGNCTSLRLRLHKAEIMRDFHQVGGRGKTPSSLKCFLEKPQWLLNGCGLGEKTHFFGHFPCYNSAISSCDGSIAGKSASLGSVLVIRLFGEISWISHSNKNISFII